VRRIVWGWWLEMKEFFKDEVLWLRSRVRKMISGWRRK
jgi:hypothetical protein